MALAKVQKVQQHIGIYFPFRNSTKVTGISFPFGDSNNLTDISFSFQKFHQVVGFIPPSL